MLEGDIGYTIFIQWWTSDQILHLDSLSRNIQVQYPLGTDAIRYLFNLPVLILTVPFQWLFDPIQAYNQSMLGIMVLNGLSAYHFGRRFGQTQGWLCAIAICALPFPWHELGKGRLEQGFVAPIILWLDSIHAFKKIWCLENRWLLSGIGHHMLLVLWSHGTFTTPHHRTKRDDAVSKANFISTWVVHSAVFASSCLYFGPLLEQFQRSHAFDDPMYLQTQMENSWMPNHSIPYASLYRVGGIPILIGLCMLYSSNRRLVLLTLGVSAYSCNGTNLRRTTTC